MSSPIEEIEVLCPACGEIYTDWYRASLNLEFDDFDEEYIEEASTATCPNSPHGGDRHVDRPLRRREGGRVAGLSRMSELLFAKKEEAAKGVAQLHLRFGVIRTVVLFMFNH